MADLEFLELIRKYLWNFLLWKNREGYTQSFNSMYKRINSDLNYALRGDYFTGLGTNFDQRIARAKQLLSEHDREVKDIIEELLLKMNRKNAKVDINRITAKAILEPLLDEVGLKYYIEYQKTGVKINVQLLPKKKGQLYMSYNRVMKESAKLIGNILKLKELYEYFGHNSGIVNISKEEEVRFKQA